MKVVSVTPELIAEMLENYRSIRTDHAKGDLELHVATNSWRHFQKQTGWFDE